MQKDFLTFREKKTSKLFRLTSQSADKHVLDVYLHSKSRPTNQFGVEMFGFIGKFWHWQNRIFKNN